MQRTDNPTIYQIHRDKRRKDNIKITKNNETLLARTESNVFFLQHNQQNQKAADVKKKRIENMRKKHIHTPLTKLPLV